MKRLIATLVVLTVMATAATARPQRQTMLYAVKGADSLRLDRYPAAGVGEKTLRPCLIFVFGGGFAWGERDNSFYDNYFDMLTANGWDVVSIDYRLGLKAVATGESDIASAGIRETIGVLKRSVDMAVEDLLTATRFVVDHADEWHVDTSRIVASGSSAGAITCLQAENCICNGDERAKVLPEGFNYAGTVAFAGAIFSVHGKPEWKSAPCPMMLFHGTSDKNVPYDKAVVAGIGFYGSKFIVKQLDKVGSPYWFCSEQYRTHDIASEPMVKNHHQILAFLQDYVLDRRRLQTVEDIADLGIAKQPTKFGVMEYIRSNYAR